MHEIVYEVNPKDAGFSVSVSPSVDHLCIATCKSVALSAINNERRTQCLFTKHDGLTAGRVSRD
jgi:hypothetical protein